MERKNIKALLERFYAGETSREEEVFLQKYFSQPNVPEELYAEKEHFLLLMQWQSESPLDESFDAQIMQKIFATPKPESRSVGWYAMAGVAASILLVLALWVGNMQDKRSTLSGTTNTALAYVQVRTALQVVSWNLNAGLRPVKNATREFSTPLKKAGKIKIIDASLKSMKKLEEINRARRLMESINSVYINLEPIKK